MSVVDLVLAEIKAQVDPGSGRNYGWTRQEDDLLRRMYGRTGRPEISEKLTTMLRQRTGDPAAERTDAALAGRASQLGLHDFIGDSRQTSLAAAARQMGISYYTLHKAAMGGAFKTRRQGKRNYGDHRTMGMWYLRYRAAMEAQSEVLEALEQTKTISKQEAMAMAEIRETHITRLLQTGVIRAWKLPETHGLNRPGEWLIDLHSVRDYITARAEGRLRKYLDQFPAYVKNRDRLTKEVRDLRHAGRLDKRDPLTDPQSTYHPGCFKVSQVASHCGLSTQVIYEAAKAGHIKLIATCRGGRNRYAVEPKEARRYAKWVANREHGAKRWHKRRREDIEAAGLLTNDDLRARWDVPDARLAYWAKTGLLVDDKTIVLKRRQWGRYVVYEAADVEAFEEAASLKKRLKEEPNKLFTESIAAKLNQDKRDVHEAGLLTADDLMDRWQVPRYRIGIWAKFGLIPNSRFGGEPVKLRKHGRIGRYITFRLADVESFEKTVDLKNRLEGDGAMINWSSKQWAEHIRTAGLLTSRDLCDRWDIPFSTLDKHRFD